MATPETEKLGQQIAQLVEDVKAWRERDKELEREVERHLAVLRRLAGTG
jgi:uncharacterized protein YlxW (UPF0749 family)